MAGQPDTVGAAPEPVAGLVHRARVDGEDDRLAPAGADPSRSIRISRQMDVVASHRAEPLPTDRGQEGPDRAVIKHLWRRRRRQTELHPHGMALVGTDVPPGIVDSETLLVACRHDLVELGPADRETGPGAGVE